MNKFSCSLSCTWMTIIDSLFYASDNVSWEYIAKLLVAWLYMGLVVTKPVFGVSDQTMLKPESSATETS